MSYSFGSQKTEGGYILAECISALQKEIRRGDEENAMYWAVEIESIQARYLWNRLASIVSEDIGPANGSLQLILWVLEQRYWNARERGNGGSRLFLGHAILQICRSPKSHIVDWFQMVAYRSHDGRPIPEYAFDKHTRKGKQMGRGDDQFFDEGSVVYPDADLPLTDDYKARARVLLEQGAEVKYTLTKAKGPSSRGSKRPTGDLPDDAEQSGFDL